MSAKLIQCIVRPEKVEEVVDRLEPLIDGITISEVRGYGRQKGHKLVYRGLEYDVSLLPKMMIEIVSDESWVEDIIKVVIETAGTGKMGDGRIFIFAVEEGYHIRSGFMDM